MKSIVLCKFRLSAGRKSRYGSFWGMALGSWNRNAERPDLSRMNDKAVWGLPKFYPQGGPVFFHPNCGKIEKGYSIGILLLRGTTLISSTVSDDCRSESKEGREGAKR